MPTSLTNMFRAFSPYNWHRMSFSVWKYSKVVEADDWVVNGDPLNYNFDKMDYPTNSFFLNSTDILLFVVFFTFLHPILAIIRIILPKSNYIKNMDQIFKDHFVVFMIFITFCKFNFNALLNIKLINVASPTEWSNSIGALFFLCFTACLVIFLGFNQVMYWWELRQQKKKGLQTNLQDGQLTENFRARILFRELKKTSFIHYSYWFWWIIRRILHNSIFTCWYLDGWMQILFGCLLHGVSMCWVATWKPFKDSWRNHLEVIN